MEPLAKVPKVVIPAETGIQESLIYWIPAFAGMTEKDNVGLLQEAPWSPNYESITVYYIWASSGKYNKYILTTFSY
jgi:hypothetical protein